MITGVLLTWKLFMAEGVKMISLASFRPVTATLQSMDFMTFRNTWVSSRQPLAQAYNSA